MKTVSLKRRTIPKVALVATALAGGLYVAVADMSPANAFATPPASSCGGCHAAAGVTVTATPSAATVAPGAAFTAEIVIAGGSGASSGFWVSGGGADVIGNAAAGATRTAELTAPATPGPVTYTVWARNGGSNTTTFIVTVGAGTPGPTATATGSPTATTPPTTTPPTTPAPPVTLPPKDVPSGRVDLSPTGPVGAKHLSMFKTLGSSCAGCHNGTSQAKPPTINIDKADMRSGACSSCHSSGDSDSGRSRGRAGPLFISAMKNDTVTYKRCSDCHKIADDGGSWGGGSGDGGSWGGGSGDRGSWGGGR